jgi:LDH2 family malate/lactate/ureidoglycolate dehydrogenase
VSGGRFGAEPLKTYVAALLAGYGVLDNQAQSVARNIVWSALVGRDNYSFVRLPIHLQRVRKNVLNGKAEPAFDPAGPAIVRIDGDGGFGHFVGERAMEEAIRLAKNGGVGLAGVHNSNFFGTGAYFVNMAAEAGMVGLALSNSFAKVVAHGGHRAVLGTNPFAFGAPRRNGRHILFDMATSGLAGSMVREHLSSGTPLPEGLAVDENGASITDPGLVSGGALTPFGGAKGYGVALLVEILAGVLTGAGVSHGVASLYNDFSKSGQSGHFLMAIDIARFMEIEAFYDRLEGLVTLLRGSGPEGAVLLPGEVRWQNMADNLRLGIAIEGPQIEALEELGRPVGLVFPADIAAAG